MLRRKNRRAPRAQRVGLCAVELPAPRALVRRACAHTHTHGQASNGALLRPCTGRQRHRCGCGMNVHVRHAQERGQCTRGEQGRIGQARIQCMRWVDPNVDVRFGGAADVPA